MAARSDLGALADRYDLVIVGGGITGAGIAREAVRTGASVLLVDRRDFASGTSSWSSKLVHGGLRYLRHAQWQLTLESVRERQRLLREAPDLVRPIGFLMPIYEGRKPGRALLQVGLFVYDLMSGVRRSRFVATDELLREEPHIAAGGLKGAMAYEDATTDDARLVLRLLMTSAALGATVRNYTHARADGANGVLLSDAETGATRTIHSAMTINATGAWPDASANAPALRPLRGSHFVFPAAKLPVQHAVSWLHPVDGRPIFAYPWQGVSLYGTTDLDHTGSLESPRMTPDEATYLLDALGAQFPGLALTAHDAIATYSGIRPVVAGGKGDPSAESRESAMWSGPGTVGITGGKLTTFRVTAREVLTEAAKQVPRLAPAADGPVIGEAPTPAPGDAIAGTPFTWGALQASARDEYVVHLEDLMMRRTRLGLVAEGGGASLLAEVKRVCAPELGWDDERWANEERDYLAYWQRQHAPVVT
jgi:glycerol-3-phosphate dehydrogenase